MKELSWQEISARLKTLRKENKLTIERLAEMVGVSTSFIGLIEKGESGISIENLYKLSQVFNCTLDYLVTGKRGEEAPGPHTKFAKLNSALYDYNENEIDFIIDTAKFLRSRTNLR